MKSADDLGNLKVHIDCLIVIIPDMTAIIDIWIVDWLLMADAAAMLESLALDLLMAGNAPLGYLVALFGQTIETGMIVSVY